jgi:hypothetical protein
VRGAARLTGTMLGWLEPGTLLTVDADSRREADGYVWWQHERGWSAERSSDGSQVFLVDPSVVIDTPARRDDEPPSIDELPLRDELFARLPVALDQTDWWQYFGNNVFAYELWRDGKQWYSYAQGLHGGVDFGNSRTRGVPIYAGVEGTFNFHDLRYTPPNGLWVRVGAYTIIYGHVANPVSFGVGDPIFPGTRLGELEFGGQNHLHLEIRYRGRWIVNPLLFFLPADREALIKRFSPGPTYFYRDVGWNQWQTPLDQPVITLGGGLIGPHAR